jgi:hypothetical protein
MKSVPADAVCNGRAEQSHYTKRYYRREDAHDLEVPSTWCTSSARLCQNRLHGPATGCSCSPLRRICHFWRQTPPSIKTISTSRDAARTGSRARKRARGGSRVLASSNVDLTL